MTEEAGKKKIIIDEDWKSRVDAEREEEKKQQPTPGPAETATMPPASFEMLLTTLATEAMMSLGLVPHPVSGKQEMARDQAKYFIDTLAMLQEKTAGNLTPDEDKALDGLLAQLRMAYVAGASPVATPTGGPTPPPAS